MAYLGPQRLRGADLRRVPVRPSDKRKEGAHPWVNTVIGGLFAVTVWVITGVFPLSFMIAMAWGCDSTRETLDGER